MENGNSVSIKSNRKSTLRQELMSKSNMDFKDLGKDPKIVRGRTLNLKKKD